MDLPKILLTGLFFLFFWFSSSFWTIGLGRVKKPREKPKKNKKNKKTNPEWTYPRFFSQDCFFLFFLVFFEFLDNWAWESKKPREKPKKTKKPILNGLTQDSSHRIVFFCFFFVFPEFLDNWAWESKKTSRKTKKNKKKKKQFYMDLPKILLTGLFFFVFFVFPEFLDIWKAENGKKGKKQNVQKLNAPSVGFCFINMRSRSPLLVLPPHGIFPKHHPDFCTLATATWTRPFMVIQPALGSDKFAREKYAPSQRSLTNFKFFAAKKTYRDPTQRWCGFFFPWISFPSKKQ